MARRKQPYWATLPDGELLDLRFCDLGLSLTGTVLEERVERLYEELADRGIEFRPHCWLSEEWFSPDRVPGIAIAFYLAHPRLMKLERKMMMEVEGGGESWCLKLLRHETGHALDTAFGLSRRIRWRRPRLPSSFFVPASSAAVLRSGIIANRHGARGTGRASLRGTRRSGDRIPAALLVERGVVFARSGAWYRDRFLSRTSAADEAGTKNDDGSRGRRRELVPQIAEA